MELLFVVWICSFLSSSTLQESPFRGAPPPLHLCACASFTLQSLFAPRNAFSVPFPSFHQSCVLSTSSFAPPLNLPQFSLPISSSSKSPLRLRTPPCLSTPSSSPLNHPTTKSAVIRAARSIIHQFVFRFHLGHCICINHSRGGG